MTLLASYDVNEGSGLVLTDTSGNGNDASVSDTPEDFWGGEPEVSLSVMDMEADGRSEELVTNGDFSNGSTGWTVNTGWSISGGTANATSAQDWQLLQDINAVSGSQYEVSFEVSNHTGGVVHLSVGTAYADDRITATGNGIYTGVVTGQGDSYVYFYPTALTASVDNVSVREIINNKYFTDGEGHALPTTQADWEALGSELVENGEFFSDTVWVKGDGWTISSGVASCDGTQLSSTLLAGVTALTDGVQYEATFTVSNYSAGTVKIILGGPTGQGTFRDADGVYTEIITANGTDIDIQGDVDFIGSVDNISVREVNPIINNNDQYFWKNTEPKQLSLYKNVLTGQDLIDAKEYNGVA